MDTYTIASEQVLSGHPDRICDIVSDTILEEVLAEGKGKGPDGSNPNRAGIECMATKNLLIISGEVNCGSRLDYEGIAREAIKGIGYADGSGWDYDKIAVMECIKKQSPNINAAVGSGRGGDFIGAGDQGLMFGYATNETPEFMPAGYVLAKQIANMLDSWGKDGAYSDDGKRLGPDGKCQVVLEYYEGRPVELKHVSVSMRADDSQKLKKVVCEHVMGVLHFKCSELHIASDKAVVSVNPPDGVWTFGGPNADTGLTGRKIICDTYGGYARHGGGALSGKDPTKVDRTGAYMARYIAINLVRMGLAERLEVQLSFEMGGKNPLSIMVDTFGTGDSDESTVKALAEAVRPSTVGEAIEQFDLFNVPYSHVPSQGHFGTLEWRWDK